MNVDVCILTFQNFGVVYSLRIWCVKAEVVQKKKYTNKQNNRTCSAPTMLIGLHLNR